jgi:DNA processing protein
LCERSIAIEEFEKTEKFGAKILIFSDPLYPQLLREIPDAPPLIMVKGDLDLLSQEKIAVVGPRSASFNALLYAKKFTLLLGQSSVISVSGMARGVDTAVHEASILSGTIAVLAGGINNIYPHENSKLYQQISECGVILSEMPFGFTPKSSSFIQRNRLISGLAVATVVIEAGLKSGSLATARFALEQNREVFAVPGSPFDPRCQGTNRLIKDGANIITEVEDVLNATTKKNYQVKKTAQISQIKKEYNFSNDQVFGAQEEILQNLNSEPTNIDLLISELQIPINLFNTAVMELEIDNKVAVNYGKIVKLMEG